MNDQLLFEVVVPKRCFLLGQHVDNFQACYNEIQESKVSFGNAILVLQDDKNNWSN